MTWSLHRHAPWYLGIVSFTESSFFVIPPDVMLAPMALAKPEKAWRYALITTVLSVLGGILGYLIGYLAFDWVAPILTDLGQWHHYETAQSWFADMGFWAVLLAGFTPIPYKIFTIAAGALFMPMLPFIAASLLGRGARFFLVAGLMKFGGAKMDDLMRKYLDKVGWLLALAVIGLYFLIKYLRH